MRTASLLCAHKVWVVAMDAHGCQKQRGGARGGHWFSCEWSRKIITKSFNQDFHVMLKLFLISPWQQTGKTCKRKNITFSHLTVNCSLLRANWISFQVLRHVVDLSGHCYCFSVQHQKPSTSKPTCKVHLENYLSSSPGGCALSCLGPVVRPHEQLFLQTVSLFSRPLRLQVLVRICHHSRSAASKLQLLCFADMWTVSSSPLRSRHFAPKCLFCYL